MSNILIYINAGGSYGMGHFRRSFTIAQHLELQGHQVFFTGDVNQNCISILSEKFRIFQSNDVEVDVVIIDATSISEGFRKGLNKKEKIISVSPMSHFPEALTHICSRYPIKNFFNSENKNIYVDPYFAFWGCGPYLKPTFQIKEKVNIGISISGSHQYVDISQLTSKLSKLKEVSIIKLVSNMNYSLLPSSSKLLVKEGFTDDQWNFFSDIDVFITGDGVTLYEAISRGLPSLSFCREGNSQKNAYFADHLFLQIQQIDWYTNKMLDQILDRQLLNKIKTNIEKAEIFRKSGNLGKALLTIIDGN